MKSKQKQFQQKYCKDGKNLLKKEKRSLFKEIRWETICFYMFLEDKLPQGSPASPIMSNIYLLEFDYLLTELLRNLNKHFVYTRYADDILISSREMFGWREVVRLVEELLTPYDLTLNKDKIRYGSKNGRNWNLS